MLRLPRSLRSTRGALALAGLVLAAVAACRESPTAPREQEPPPKTGRMVVYAALGAAASINGIVIDVSGPGIVKADGATPDTLSFNLAVANGVASGSIEVPAGESRTITAHAFDGVVETHRGTRTGVNVAEGVNPTLSLTLLPLVGDQPITLSFGTTIVTVTPAEFGTRVGDSALVKAAVRDQNNTILVGAQVRWATLNPGRASVRVVDDSSAFVTLLDTGDVQIVATYGTVGGSAKGHGIARLDTTTPPAYTLRWNGSVSRDWNTANNWTPYGAGAARVPTLSDSVIVPAGTPRDPQVGIAQSVRDLLVESGATVTSVCCSSLIQVYGSANVRGPGVTTEVQLRGASARVKGTYYRLSVNAAVARLDSAVQVRENLYVFGAGANLSLAGKRLQVDNYLEVSSSGLVTMADPDTLRVLGSIHWNGGDETGRLAGGVLDWSGGQNFSFYGYRYRATGTNKVRFTGTSRQQIGGFDFINAPGNSSLARWEIANVGGVYLCGHVQTLDSLTIQTPVTIDNSCGGYWVRAGGPVTTVAGSRLVSHGWDLRDATGTSRVAGDWSPIYTDVHNSAAALDSTKAYQNLRFYVSHALQHSYRTSGHVYVDGAGVELDVNGHRLDVGTYLDVDDNALLVMDAAADTVDVPGDAFFRVNNSGVQQGRMSAGLLRVGGRFYGLGFGATGSHTVELAGTGATAFNVDGMDYPSRPANVFRKLEVTGGAPINICEHLRADSVVVRAGATLRYSPNCGGYTLRVERGVRVEPTAYASAWVASLGDTSGTRGVAGTWGAVHTDFGAAGAYINPAIAYQNLRIYAANALRGDTRTSGFVYVNGGTTELDVAGYNLDVGTYLELENNGATLVMDSPADTVNVPGDMLFQTNNSAAHAARLTAGLLRVGGRFYGLGFGASGTHKVLLTGGLAGTSTANLDGIDVQSRPQNQFARLEIAPTAAYTLCGHVRATDSLTLRAGGQLLKSPCGNWWLYAVGPITTEPGSRFAGYGISIYHPNGTRDVNGDWLPDHTDFNTANNYVKPGLPYNNLRFYASNSLRGPQTVNGYLYVNGTATEFSPSGFPLRVRNYLHVDNGAVLVMTNPADSVEVDGNLTFDSNVNSALQGPRLTRGVLRAGGNDMYMYGFASSEEHRVVLTGANAANRVVRLYGMDSRSRPANAFRDLVVDGAKVNLDGQVRVLDSLTVGEASEINQTGGGYYLRVDGELVTGRTSIVRPYVVELLNASGTANVAGTWSPEYTDFWSGAAQAIKPGLAYRKLRVFAAANALQGSTAATEGVWVSGGNASLDLNGHTLSAGPSFRVENQGQLFMRSENDSLLTTYFYMNDRAHNAGQITAGLIRVTGGNFEGYTFSADPQGTARVELAGTGVRRVYGLDYNSRPWQGFQHVEIDTGATVELCSHVLARKSLVVRSGAALRANCGGYWVRTDEDLVV
ncbi:MAG: hypothetical protein ACJ8AO_17695, partial [Gemmatimonadaceae bacterium]